MSEGVREEGGRGERGREGERKQKKIHNKM